MEHATGYTQSSGFAEKRTPNDFMQPYIESPEIGKITE